jgi:hypothetical protein
MSAEISEVKDERGHFTVERLLKIRFVKRIRVWLYLLINHPDLRRILVTLIIFQIIFYFYLTKGKTFCIDVRYQLNHNNKLTKKTYLQSFEKCLICGFNFNRTFSVAFFGTLRKAMKVMLYLCPELKPFNLKTF